ncbi:MAG: hypothetical protein GY928_40255 [Colwellia sp.]|nr:hypothetical protein [Colwellia sp.]
MTKVIESELEKLNMSLTQSNKILTINTELRVSNISSNSKIINLIYSSDDKPTVSNPSYLLRTKPVDLQLKKPVFVSKVEVITLSQKNIRLDYIDTLGNKHTKRSTSSSKNINRAGHLVVITINAPISQFSLSTVEGEVSLTRVKAFIYNEATTASDSPVALANHLARLNVVQDRATRIADLLESESIKISDKLSELESKEASLINKEEELTESIEVKTSEIELLDNEIRENDEGLQDIRNNLSDVTATLKLSREEVESLEQSKNSYSEELTNLKAEVRQESSTLKQLKRDVDVFSEDLKAYTGETRKQQMFYGLICFILLGVLIFITNTLFDRAGELITNFDEGKINSIWDVVISRIPFMLSIIGIVTFIAEGMRRCINQIISLHDQRLTFLRLSIVAREVVDVSTEDEDIDQDTIVKLRMKLKLAMLRQHMEKDLGSGALDIDLGKSNVVDIKQPESDSAA